MECDDKARAKCTWGLHRPGFGSYCLADYPNCYQVTGGDMPEEEKPICINVDHSTPGYVLIRKEDWDKVLKYFKETTTLVEFNEGEGTFINHQRGECNDGCPVCELGILFHERGTIEDA